jgi:hypothetical protein
VYYPPDSRCATGLRNASRGQPSKEEQAVKLTIILLLGLSASLAVTTWAEPSVTVGKFGQEVRQFYTSADGLPSDDVYAVAVSPAGDVYAGTANGLARFTNGKWSLVETAQGAPVKLLDVTPGGQVFAVFRGALCDSTGNQLASLPPAVREADGARCLSLSSGAFLGTDQGLFRARGSSFEPVDELNGMLRNGMSIRAIACDAKGQIAVATESGLFYQARGGAWEELRPRDATRAWWPVDARCVAYDGEGRLWFGCAHGAGVLEDTWTLYTGSEGLPYDDFTAMAVADNGIAWFGTRIGAVRYDNEQWAYRQGLRWLPDDEVRDIAVNKDGEAWVATPKGIALVGRQPMTLAEKAKFYEDEIDKYHRRTEYEYVLEVGVDTPGQKTGVTQHDSDNDGLWTCMYGAGECYAYAATKDPKAKERAVKVWKAMKQLGDVTQGGSHPAPPGFVARTILPTDGWNPNEEHYTPEKDREKQQGDKYWKVIEPRWPTSEDGKWYWKTDTSSDELDGHYFFYALYYDLVAENEEEKAPVRKRVRELTDHLIEHDFCLVDHDGKPTRWAVFSPKAMNGDHNWFAERGLNSLSMLSYLSVAEHVTGDTKYREAADMLIKDHHYAQNMQYPKLHMGPGTGNQSDDEMAFMSYYHLVRYEKDPKLKMLYAFSLARYWMLEQPEMNPFFNFVYAACCQGMKYDDVFGTYPLFGPDTEWLDDSVETLIRFPLDRFNWRYTNSHRKDIVPLPSHARTFDSRARGKGCRVNGKVVPVDEQHFNHWNHDVWQLDGGSNGTGLSDGAVFTLPYYMGLYHGFIKEE